jgi:hypothetical protein
VAPGVPVPARPPVVQGFWLAALSTVRLLLVVVRRRRLRGMEREKADFRLRGGVARGAANSATAARLPLKAWQRSPRPVASGSSPAQPFAHHRDELPRVTKARRAVRLALLELELVGRAEYLADRITLCASANETTNET